MPQKVVEVMYADMWKWLGLPENTPVAAVDFRSDGMGIDFTVEVTEGPEPAAPDVWAVTEPPEEPTPV